MKSLASGFCAAKAFTKSEKTSPNVPLRRSIAPSDAASEPVSDPARAPNQPGG